MVRVGTYTRSSTRVAAREHAERNGNDATRVLNKIKRK